MALWYQPPPTLNLISSTLKLNSLCCSCSCNLSIPNSRPTHIPELKPIFASVKTFAPATVGNLGPGFDFLSYAVDGLGIRSVGLSLSLEKGLPLAKPKTSASTNSIKIHKSLEASAVVGKLSDTVHLVPNSSMLEVSSSFGSTSSSPLLANLLPNRVCLEDSGSGGGVRVAN